MYRDRDGYTVITGKDILRWFNTPIGILICGIICSIIAFNTGIKYSQNHVKVRSVTSYYAFIEIAGEERMYARD